MLEKSAKISSIIQGVAALVFLYSYFSQGSAQQATDSVVQPVNHPAWLPTAAITFLAVSVITASVLNLILQSRLKHTSPRDEHGNKTTLTVSDGAKDEAEFAKSVGQMTGDEIDLKIRTDPVWVARLNSIPRNKYGWLPHDPTQPNRSVTTLEQRTFEVAKEVCLFLKTHGPEPKVEDAKKNGFEPLDWHWEKIQPWRTRVGAGWRAHLKDKVDKIRDELAEQGLMDSELNAAIDTRLYTEQDFRTIAERLRFVASHLEC
ncbi:MAG: hypothetical protein WAN29_10685 [Candidatus Sulfotelmatobacter sp.]